MSICRREKSQDTYSQESRCKSLNIPGLRAVMQLWLRYLKTVWVRSLGKCHTTFIHTQLDRFYSEVWVSAVTSMFWSQSRGQRDQEVPVTTSPAGSHYDQGKQCGQEQYWWSLHSVGVESKATKYVEQFLLMSFFGHILGTLLF